MLFMQPLFDIMILQQSSDNEIFDNKRKLFKIKFILSGKNSIIYAIISTNQNKYNTLFFMNTSMASGSIIRFLRSPEISTRTGVYSLSFNQINYFMISRFFCLSMVCLLRVLLQQFFNIPIRLRSISTRKLCLKDVIDQRRSIIDYCMSSSLK